MLTLGALVDISQFQPFGFCWGWLCSVRTLPAMLLPQYFPWPELLAVSDCGIKVSFAIFYIPVRCRVLAAAQRSLPGCLGGRMELLSLQCCVELQGAEGRGCRRHINPTLKPVFKSFAPATQLHFPRVLNDWKIGTQINTTARGLRHRALAQHQAGGCLQKDGPQNVAEISA